MSTFFSQKKTQPSLQQSPSQDPLSPTKSQASPQKQPLSTRYKPDDLSQTKSQVNIFTESQRSDQSTVVATPSAFDLVKTHQQVTQCISSGFQNFASTFEMMKLSLNQTSEQQIAQNLQQHKQLLLPLVGHFREILIARNNPQIDEEILEQSAIVICEAINKLMATAPPNQFQRIVDEQLMDVLILNTAHPKGSVRKISRSCIANYVRQYKDLKPILLSFREHGINKNADLTSQQWIILILPNLLNLDQSVISQDCIEFVELIKVLHSICAQTGINGKKVNGENDVPRACSKVINELLKRFTQFEGIYMTINQNYKPDQIKEEAKRKPKSKPKSLELVYGFLDLALFSRLGPQNQSQQDRTKAFEEALTCLQTFKATQQTMIKYPELIQFLGASLSESTNLTQITATAIKMINICLGQQQMQKQSFNVAKLTNVIVQRLIDQNKNVRSEAQQYFQYVQRLMGIKAYSNLITNFLENLCTQQSQLVQSISIHQVTTLVDSVLNLVYSNAMKVKSKDDVDLILLMKAFSCALAQDKDHSSKIIDILSILGQQVYSPTDILQSAQDFLSADQIILLEEKLGINQQKSLQNVHTQHQTQSQPLLKRNASIPPESQQQQLILHLKVDKTEDLKKKQQLLLPNINHQSHLSPSKQSNQNSSKGTSQGQRIAAYEVFQSTQMPSSTNTALKETPQAFKSIASSTQDTTVKAGFVKGYKNRIQLNQPIQLSRYSNMSADAPQKQTPQSPFTSTTMTSISDRVHLVKKAQSDPNYTQDQQKQQITDSQDYGVYSTQNAQKPPAFSRNKFNSQSHQVLPQISNIQKNTPNQRTTDQTKTINASASNRNQHQSKSLAPLNAQSTPNIALEKGSSTKDMENGFKKQQMVQGKIKLDPTYFQQTNNSLTGSIGDQFSTKTSQNKPGSGNTQKSLKFMRGTVTSLGADSSNATANEGGKGYLSINELEPLVNPELEWKMFLNDIKSDNWSRQFEACNVIRKVCKFHLKDIVYGGVKSSSSIQKQTQETFHDINIQIIKMVDSLRSTVSKQGMITLSEMFESLPKQLLEQDVDNLFQVLIKKSIDSNVFMAEEGERCLISMCRTLTEGKVLSCLMIQKSNKASVMRSQICRCLAVIHTRIKQSQQQARKIKANETERQIVGQLGQYMVDAAQEVRNQAKIAFQQLVNLYDEFSSREDLQRMLEQSLNEQTFKKVSDYIESDCV